MGTRRFPIRVKLTIATLIPLVVATALCGVIGVSIIDSRVVKQAQEKVRTDLNSARAVYQSEIDHIRDVIKFTATNPFTSTIISQGDRTTLNNILTPRMNSEGLDFLTVVDRSGRVVFRASNHGAFGDSKINDQIVSRALGGEHIAGTEIIPPEELVKEGTSLAQRSAIHILPTPHARRRDETVERSGMAMVVSVPVRDRAGAIVGVLYGGVLLNGNNDMVDRIKKIVFEAVEYRGKDVGTATIFQGDLRIATNVLISPERRAIGTRLSEEVYKKVIVSREKWVGRAFVVNEWYYSAYEPILNLRGIPVGSLYVGINERPYLELKREIFLIFAVVLLCGSIIGIALSSYIASRLSQPIKELETAARRIAAGERNLAITVNSRDEIEELANEFAQMTNTLTQREEDIQELNRELEQKVLERTAQLEEKNRLLVKTQEDLVRAAKLADIGMLAAGVAHEINNPMAIIRGNTELLQMAMPDDDPNLEEVDTIVQQVGRVERIVGSLLKFARENHKQIETVAIDALLNDIIKQVGHQVPLTGIEVRRDYAADLPPLEADSDQLRQVFTNLILNAIQAMKQGGVLTLSTSCGTDEGTCVIAVGDTGTGILPENRKKIFSPFFTTRNEGTGLGLAVSYGIIKDHGGNIQVESTIGEGSTFRVVLPLKQGSPEAR